MTDEAIFIETHQVGRGVEVRAVDAGDGLEVSFIAPASASRSEIERLALAKLAYVRRRGSGGSDGGAGGGGTGGGVLA